MFSFLCLKYLKKSIFDSIRIRLREQGLRARRRLSCRRRPDPVRPSLDFTPSCSIDRLTDVSILCCFRSTDRSMRRFNSIQNIIDLLFVRHRCRIFAEYVGRYAFDAALAANVKPALEHRKQTLFSGAIRQSRYECLLCANRSIDRSDGCRRRAVRRRRR